jgi:putative SOS response-associated peptidase YedK
MLGLISYSSKATKKLPVLNNARAGTIAGKPKFRALQPKALPHTHFRISEWKTRASISAPISRPLCEG